MNRDDLTSVEQDVLRCLSESRTTASVVTLASDLWHTTDDWQAWDVEPLITWVLHGLNEKGLITFRLSKMLYEVDADPEHMHRQERPVTLDVPTVIRLTRDGWTLMGYPNMTAQVGTRGTHMLPGRPGDLTDYKNHHQTAVGGVIEKEDFATHRDMFPTHVHMYYDEEPIMPRDYTKVTPEIEASVIYAKNKLGATAYADIADVSGVPERTVRYILTDLPRLRRMHDGDEHASVSLKERIVTTLQELDEVADSRELVRILGMGDPEHDVVHVLHSLHTQGRVDFTEGGRSDQPKRIHMRKKGRNGATVRMHGAKTADPIEPANVEVVSEPTYVDEPAALQAVPIEYPLLDALLDRERERQSQDNKGMAYITAAEAIQDIDPEAARGLMEKAEAMNVPFPSPIEQEYLLYVSQHGRKDTES